MQRRDLKLSPLALAGHRGLPSVFGQGMRSKPMPDWRVIQVLEMEDGYPELSSFGPAPSHGFFIRHLKNIEMSHVEVAPANADPRGILARRCSPCGFFAITAPVQPNFALHNVADLRSSVARGQGYDAPRRNRPDTLKIIDPMKPV